MNGIKSYLAVGLGSGLLLALQTAYVWSAPVSRQDTFVNGEAIIGGTSIAKFNLVVRDALNSPYNVKSQVVEWDVIDPQVTPGWQLSNSMLDITWTVTDAFGGIQIYTDNMNASASPQFLDPTPGKNNSDYNSHNLDSNPAGLLFVEPTGSTSSQTLPMGWSVKPVPAQINSGLPNQDLFAADPDTGPATGLGNRYQWFYMLDSHTPAIDRDGDGSWTSPLDSKAFKDGDPYIKVIDHQGIHMTQGPADYIFDESKRAYIYFMANFDTAGAKAVYRTSRLILEAYLE